MSPGRGSSSSGCCHVTSASSETAHGADPLSFLHDVSFHLDPLRASSGARPGQVTPRARRGTRGGSGDLPDDSRDASRSSRGPSPPSIVFEVWSADASGIETLEALVGGRCPVKTQGEGDLGARLEEAFDAAFTAGSGRVAILGTDSPDVPLAAIEKAGRLLEAHDLGLGPTSDGGYWLVGLSRPAPGLFAGIPWSSGRELEATRAAARAAGLTLAEAPSWYDIDHIEDLEHFAERNAQSVDPSLERLRAVVRRHLPGNRGAGTSP